MTTAELQALKTSIAADPVLSLLENTADNAFTIAAAYNQPAAPAFIVWRTSVTQDEIMLNGFDWARVDNLTAGKARVWEWMFDNEARAFNPSKPNIRAGIDAAWVGTAADIAVRAAVYVHCKRSASRVEKILATGTGNDATPATMTFEGTIGYLDVLAARSLP